MPTVQEKRELTVFEEIFKNTKMGADAIINLLPHVKDDHLRSVMTQQLDGYEKYAARAARSIEGEGGEAREENLITRLSAKVGMAFSTMVDSTTSHIAEMMVEGSNTGITDMTKLLNAHDGYDDVDAALRLAREVVAFEEHNLERLKHFL